MDTAEPLDTAELGEVIGGYRLDRVLGAGGASCVFLGTHVRIGRQAAIKVLATPLTGDEQAVLRMLNEARIVNDIGHPNIIDVADFIESAEPRRVALVMEYIAGPNLATVLSSGPLPLHQALGVVDQLIDAVQAAHGAGVIHRDIKPENLLLVRDPRTAAEDVPVLKVADFGVAQIAGAAFGRKTASGVMIGTPAYMAPEQVAGKPPPSAATDAFAIAEVLYEVLTGKRCYPRGTMSELVRNKLRGAVPDLELDSLPCGEILGPVIARALALRPHDRPSLAELAAAIESVSSAAEEPTVSKGVASAEDAGGEAGYHDAETVVPTEVGGPPDGASPYHDSTTVVSGPDAAVEVPDQIPTELAPASPAARRRRVDATTAALLFLLGAVVLAAVSVWAVGRREPRTVPISDPASVTAARPPSGPAASRPQVELPVRQPIPGEQARHPDGEFGSTSTRSSRPRRPRRPGRPAERTAPLAEDEFPSW